MICPLAIRSDATMHARKMIILRRCGFIYHPLLTAGESNCGTVGVRPQPGSLATTVVNSSKCLDHWKRNRKVQILQMKLKPSAKMTFNSSPSTVALDQPQAISASQEELKRGFYDNANIQKALEALHQDGFVVLKSIVNVDHIDKINEFMSKEADNILENNLKPFNHRVKCKMQISQWCTY